VLIFFWFCLLSSLVRNCLCGINPFVLRWWYPLAFNIVIFNIWNMLFESNLEVPPCLAYVCTWAILTYEFMDPNFFISVIFYFCGLKMLPMVFLIRYGTFILMLVSK
jgi:hypothetical protein